MRVIIEPSDSAEKRMMAKALEANLLATFEEELVSRGSPDERLALALRQLLERGVLRRQYDYAWLLQLVNEGRVAGMMPLRSPQKWIDYLRQLGFTHLPSRVTLSDAVSTMRGQWDHWTFADTSCQQETLRRNNVARQFLSAYNKA